MAEKTFVLVHPLLPGREQVVRAKQAAVLARSGWVEKKSDRQKKRSEVSPTPADVVPQLEADDDKDKE